MMYSAGINSCSGHTLQVRHTPMHKASAGFSLLSRSPSAFHYFFSGITIRSKLSPQISQTAL
jgi:hypothetical protein